MIIINAYEGLAFLLGLVFLKWISFAIGSVCKRQGEGLVETPVARAVHLRPRPLQRLGEWLDDITTPTSQRSSTVFSDVETKEDEPELELGSPTAAATRLEETTGADATLDNAGLRSYG